MSVFLRVGDISDRELHNERNRLENSLQNTTCEDTIRRYKERLYDLCFEQDLRRRFNQYGYGATK